MDSVSYTAGPRGFRPRGKNIARKYDLSQVRPPGAKPGDPLDAEDPSYNFGFRTRTYNREEGKKKLTTILFNLLDVEVTLYSFCTNRIFLYNKLVYSFCQKVLLHFFPKILIMFTLSYYCLTYIKSLFIIIWFLIINLFFKVLIVLAM